MEKYSVLMSIYAKVKKEELQTSVDSMLNQTAPPDEFIIVFDGSVAPDVAALVDSYEIRHPGLFTLIRLPENHGLAYALNQGLRAARNELVARMDSDDYSLPDRCLKQLSRFEKDPDLVLLGTSIGYFTDNPDAPLGMERKYHEDIETIRKVIRRNDPFNHPTVMYKKSKVLEIGGYDPSLRRRQDYDLFSKMVVHCNWKASNIEEPLLLFRVDENFHLRNKNKESCTTRIEVQKKIYQRGDCSLSDYLYVWLIMKASQMMPVGLYKIIYKTFRSKA